MDTAQMQQQLERRWRQRFAVLVVVALTIALVPAVVLASHDFADVPDSNPFHEDISRAYDARITAGCGGENYCPKDHVTREQMAAFLGRTGSRVGFSGVDTGGRLLTTSQQVVATVVVKAGNVSGGTAFVYLSASVSYWALNATGLPAFAGAFIREAGKPGMISGWGYGQIDAIASGFAGVDTAAVEGVVAVPTNVTTTFEVVAQQGFAGAQLYAAATISAVAIPFSEDGDNVLSIASFVESPAERPELLPKTP